MLQFSAIPSITHHSIAFLFGGRAAEEVIFKDVTTGASNDIERATDIARRMVCEWGMSDKIGPLALEKREGPVFLGMQQAASIHYSDIKAQEIDAEVRRIITEGHDKAVKILKENMTILHNMSNALLEHETIDADEVEGLMKGMTLEEIKNRRDDFKSKMELEQKAAAAQTAEEEKKKASGGSDPVGNTGPVTA